MGYLTDDLVTNSSGNFGVGTDLAVGGNVQVSGNLDVNTNSVFDGKVAIGGALSVNTKVKLIASSLDGSSVQFAMSMRGENSFTPTLPGSYAVCYDTGFRTANQTSAKVTANFLHFNAAQGTLGTNHTLTKEVGFYASGATTGAVSYASLADHLTFTGAYFLNSNSAGYNNYLRGQTGIGAVNAATTALQIGGLSTSGVTQYLVSLAGVNSFAATGTTSLYGVYSGIKTAATDAPRTTGILAHYAAANTTLGTNHTVTREILFYAPATKVGTNMAALADNAAFTADAFISQTGTTNSALAGDLHHTGSGYGFVHDTGLWEDLRFPAQGINPPGAESDPDRNTTTGLLMFDDAATETVAGVAQMPHGWKSESNVVPHVHWMATQATPPADGTNAVMWTFSYAVKDVGESWDQSTYATNTVTSTVNAFVSSNAVHQLTDFADIDMTGKQDSAVIFWKLSRIGGNEADTYNADAQLVEVDFHYRINTLGSLDEHGDNF